MSMEEHDYEATFVDVGQGDATVINQLVSRRSVLVDAAAGNPVISVLRSAGELEAIFVTHWHKDHIGGIPAVLDWLAKQQRKNVSVYVNPQFSSTRVEERLRRTLDEKYEDGIINLKSAFNDAMDSGEIIGGIFRILWPRWKEIVTKPDGLNLGSLIILVRIGSTTLLFGGDAGGDVWPKVDQKALSADILKYPHHASRLQRSENDWTADNLISKVKPAWVIFSVGKKKQYGHPSGEFVVAQRKHASVHFVSTGEGSVRLRIESATRKVSRSA